MSVLTCSRRGCPNIMCDRYSYILTEYFQQIGNNMDEIQLLQDENEGLINSIRQIESWILSCSEADKGNSHAWYCEIQLAGGKCTCPMRLHKKIRVLREALQEIASNVIHFKELDVVHETWRRDRARQALRQCDGENNDHNS